jgi:hypothetical protein
MGHSDEELAAKEAELKASALWVQGDHIIAIRFVDPAETRGAAARAVTQ